MSHSVSQSVCLSTSLSLRQAVLDRQSRDSRTDRQAVSESMILPACAYAVTRIVSESVTQNVAICCMLGKVQDRTGQEKTGKHHSGQDRTGQDRTGQDRRRQENTIHYT